MAELEPPANGKTSWDFSLIDPFAIDFAQATEGHSAIWNFSTIPQWMFKTDKPVPYPADPNQPVWDYEQGTELRDPSMKEVADYYAPAGELVHAGRIYGRIGQATRVRPSLQDRLLGGAQRSRWRTPHEPADSTRALYDAVVGAIRKVDPKMKFVGAGIGWPLRRATVLRIFPESQES